MKVEADRDDRAARDDRPRRQPGGGFVTSLLVVLTAGVLALGLMRIGGMDGNQYTVAALALTPYLTAVALLVGLLALLLRRWLLGWVVLAICSVLVAAVAPRAFATGRPYLTGPHVVVMTANLYEGHSDPASLVSAVRQNHVDVLSLQELTPDEAADLDRAGLADLLPNRVYQPGDGATGTGIAARYPLRELPAGAPSPYHRPTAVVDLPSGQQLQVVAVHVISAQKVGAEGWRRDLGSLPARHLGGPLQILAGDFNATLDHAALRGLVNTGYADAAAETGDGLLPTFPAYESLTLPKVTIDHVLVDHRASVEHVQVFDQINSDHDVLLAEITLPS